MRKMDRNWVFIKEQVRRMNYGERYLKWGLTWNIIIIGKKTRKKNYNVTKPKNLITFKILKDEK